MHQTAGKKGYHTVTRHSCINEFVRESSRIYWKVLRHFKLEAQISLLNS